MTSLLLAKKYMLLLWYAIPTFLGYFSYIYASNYARGRNILWHNLKTIKGNFTGKWLLGEDFYEILCIFEQKGGRPINSLQSNEFWMAINYCQLTDMGF